MTEKLKGGRADGLKFEDFDTEQLYIGIGHELEHTDDTNTASEIAMDHLTEDKDYYKKSLCVGPTESLHWQVKKGKKLARKMKFQGLDISIETDKGQLRHWYDPHNKEEGTTKMKYPYGYICRADGDDGELLDTYIGPNHASDKVFVIHQNKAPDFDKYDESKTMLGFNTAREAKAAYLAHYNTPKFFDSMTQTNMEAFKRMFVRKSEDDIAGTYNTLIKSYHGSCGDELLEKGLLDSLSKLWAKVKEKFGGAKKVESPKKKWIRNTDQECRTGVCIRLDGVEIDIDGTFTAMKGMQIDGPPAHTSCKCTLDFSMEKALGPGAPNQPTQHINTTLLMPMVDPHDVETYEGVLSLLNRIGSVKDRELMQIAGKIWGSGYTFEGMSPRVARTEIVGFLLDQRDLLGVQQEVVQPAVQQSPDLPAANSFESTNYSKVSSRSVLQGNQSGQQGVNSYAEEYPSQQSSFSSDSDYWKKPQTPQA